RRSADGVHIYGVMIYDSRDPLNKKLILAKSGKMEESENKKFVYLILKNGWEYEERGNRSMDNNEFVRSSFKEFREVIDLSSFALSRTPIDLFKTSYQMLNVNQLTKAIDSLRGQIKYNTQSISAEINNRYSFSRWGDTGWLKTSPPPLKVATFDSLIAPNQLGYVYDRVKMNLREASNNLGLSITDYDQRIDAVIRHKIEWQRKFTLSFACMVLFLIGAPLGSIIRKGGLGTPLVFAVAFFVIFHVISTIGERLARNNVMTPGGGMWMATIILVPIAGFLIYKALNDSQLFNQEFYFRLFKNMKKLLLWKKKAGSSSSANI
ncbi:MAG: LptF/LptG family permease, partial [Chitinophagaceae bacterium]